MRMGEFGARPRRVVGIGRLIIAHMNLQPSGLGPTAARDQTRSRRVVGMPLSRKFTDRLGDVLFLASVSAS